VEAAPPALAARYMALGGVETQLEAVGQRHRTLTKQLSEPSATGSPPRQNDAATQAETANKLEGFASRSRRTVRARIGCAGRRGLTSR